MIIRHAEKPLPGRLDRSVSIDGFHAKHELTVRGWQRAAALVRFFAPIDTRPDSHKISTPRSIIASAATIASPSLRAQRTVEPLATALGIAIDNNHAEAQEARVATAALAATSPVLIAWHHHCIPELARLIGGDALDCPGDWPDDRFDIVWILDRADPGGSWSFSQVPQQLFVHDRADLIQG